MRKKLLQITGTELSTLNPTDGKEPKHASDSNIKEKNLIKMTSKSLFVARTLSTPKIER